MEDKYALNTESLRLGNLFLEAMALDEKARNELIHKSENQALIPVVSAALKRLDLADLKSNPESAETYLNFTSDLIKVNDREGMKILFPSELMAKVSDKQSELPNSVVKATDDKDKLLPLHGQANLRIEKTADKINEQVDVFKAAIHAPTQAEKGRLLQHHQELINIANYYEDAVKSHAASNTHFWEALNSGKYEQMLVDTIKENRLNMYDPPAAFAVKSNLSLANKTYEKDGSLQGFDIDLGQGKKSLHVDLKDYAPEGTQSAQEIKQLKEDFYDIYQATIKNNPEKSEKYFNTVADKFPNGISWQSPTQMQAGEGVLVMHGKPNLAVIVSPEFGEAFLLLHSQSANRLTGRVDVSSQNNTAPSLVNLTENQSNHLTPAQKTVHAYLSHVASLPKEEQKPHIEGLKDFDLKAIEAFVKNNIPKPEASLEDQVVSPKDQYSDEIDQGIMVDTKAESVL